ncbi:MAG: LacI family transcriptional regulator [Bacteroidetes bacterium]|nr:LacI family transcriptional regulator [Bacteroidota bacterium]MBU1678292.1 LacI family transcriptional regulator [Bacteroidota bacterium]MBU2507049.1 LacI family transcriptional regulator [Bacteroidota bacterium]
MTQPTIKDIAKKLNISPSTVSRALNDHPDISAETKRLVEMTSKELNYFPNTIAQSLKTKRSTTIGVIVPEIKHDFFSSAISGIEKVAYQSGYTIMVCQSNESYEREVINTKALASQRIAGLVISISQNTVNGNHFKALQKRGMPIVFFDRVCDDVDASKVVINDEESAYKAVNHLIERGYTKIAHITGPLNLKICKDREEGYKKALREHSLFEDKDFIISSGLHEENGYQSMEALFNLGKIPDAIFAVNDPVAIGAFKKIKEYGLKIPDDIAIVGFSNNPITSLVEPPITTVNQPSFGMGQRAAELLIKQIESDAEFKPVTEVLKTTLIVRGSS